MDKAQLFDSFVDSDTLNLKYFGIIGSFLDLANTLAIEEHLNYFDFQYFYSNKLDLMIEYKYLGCLKKYLAFTIIFNFCF